ncbi:hypothetical protein [Levyella massiliensis]|uniref:hypothetical protein n=1 Tax=Levyella massiliensis TaxID=938289 RepID=UPI00035C5813|nr:hypothetical protein [Levyella massiliensis]
MDRKRVNLLMVNILALGVAYVCAMVMQNSEFFSLAFPYILVVDSVFVCYKKRDYITLLVYGILMALTLSNQWLHWNPNFGGLLPGGVVGIGLRDLWRYCWPFSTSPKTTPLSGEQTSKEKAL